MLLFIYLLFSYIMPYFGSCESNLLIHAKHKAPPPPAAADGLEAIKSITEFPKVGYVGEVIDDVFSMTHPDLPESVVVKSGP